MVPMCVRRLMNGVGFPLLPKAALCGSQRYQEGGDIKREGREIWNCVPDGSLITLGDPTTRPHRRKPSLAIVAQRRGPFASGDLSGSMCCPLGQPPFRKVAPSFEEVAMSSPSRWHPHHLLMSRRAIQPHP